MAQTKDRTLPRASTKPGGRPLSNLGRPPTTRRRASPQDDTSIVAAVGLRLKQLRTQANLTLEALSEKSGVSRAMLSKVERGEKSPTLTIFVRIATGLGVPLSKLMGAETAATNTAIVRADKRLIYRDPETGFERHILSPNHIDNGIELLLHRIPPGKSSGLLPAYNVATEKLLVVHEGQLTVRAGDRSYQLASGDSFYFEVLEPYSFVNEGTNWCSYYLVIAQRR
jgi:transcriptional regulator with XRE-family HTH domain